MYDFLTKYKIKVLECQNQLIIDKILSHIILLR
jgi:hypothetical protein